MRHSLQYRAVGRRARVITTALAAAMVTALAQPVLAQQFQAPDIEVDEGDDASFTITLPEDYYIGIRWSYTTEDGTATSGDDYTKTEGSAVFPAGVTTVTVAVPTTADNQTEDDETFSLKLFGLQSKRPNAPWITPPYGVRGVPNEKTINAVIRD